MRDNENCIHPLSYSPRGVHASGFTAFDFMRTAIIIPTFNGKHLLEELLPKLLSELHQENVIIKIVDNNSNDGTEKYLETYQENPMIEVVKLTHNAGFTGGCNAGAGSGSEDVYLFLNNDCFLTQAVFREMVQALEKNPQVCAVQPVIKKKNGSIENAGFLMDKTIAKAQAVQDPDQYPDMNEYMKWNDSLDYFYGLSATCMAVRGHIFHSLRGFDDSFHSYLEDVDFAIRMAKAGHVYSLLPNLEVVHAHMATSSKMGSYKAKRDFVNWIRIIRKHYSAAYIRNHAGKLLVERGKNLNGVIKRIFS